MIQCRNSDYAIFGPRSGFRISQLGGHNRNFDIHMYNAYCKDKSAQYQLPNLDWSVQISDTAHWGGYEVQIPP